jgi:hypothetical protein
MSTLTAAIFGHVQLARILTDIERFLRKYIVLNDDQVVAVTLWIVHTHTIEAADTTPYIHATSATKRSGKTRLLEVAEPVVRSPWLTGRTSAAALVRKIDAEQPTFLLDEIDAAFGGEKEFTEALRGILNSGYKRSGKASLCIGKGADLSVRDFSTFCPKMLAGIGKLPDTVADRSIQIQLRRRMVSEPVQRWRDRDGRAEAAPLHRALAAWSRTALETLRAARPHLPAELTDRAQDVWEPLLAIAEQAGDIWPERARKAAVRLMGAVEDTDPATELLTDIREIVMPSFKCRDCRQMAFDKTVIESLATTDLIQKLVAREERPWATWRRDEKPITARGVARILGPLGIHPHQHQRVRGYRVDAFVEAFSRYLPPQVCMCAAANKNAAETPHTCDSRNTSANASVQQSEADFIGHSTHTHIEAGDDDVAGCF